MAEAKTKATNVSVKDFISGLDSDKRRREADELVKIYEKATGWKAKMWGPTIIGFGRYAYTYDSGHSGESLVVGFSPRKGAISIYPGIYHDAVPEVMEKLGKTRTGKGCVYVNKLEDIDTAVLGKLLKLGVANMEKQWGVSAE